jgi:hypothetical protein
MQNCRKGKLREMSLVEDLHIKHNKNFQNIYDGSTVRENGRTHHVIMIGDKEVNLRTQRYPFCLLSHTATIPNLMFPFAFLCRRRGFVYQCI